MPTETVEKNPRQVQVKFYSEFYRRYKSDSPDTSRSSLLRRSSAFMSGLSQEDLILELGSGRQIVTREYLRDRSTQPSFAIVTLDIANLSRKQLLAKNSDVVSHFRADGGQLPFKTSSFSLVVSSMALDFMGEGAIPEVYRVLEPGGRAEINLHHPNLIPSDLDILLAGRKIPRAERTVLEYWDYLRRNNVLTDDPSVLRERFTKYGFSVDRLVEACDSHDTWWEISVEKPSLTKPKSKPVEFIYHTDMSKEEVIKILAGVKFGFFTDWGNV